MTARDTDPLDGTSPGFDAPAPQLSPITMLGDVIVSDADLWNEHAASIDSRDWAIGGLALPWAIYRELAGRPAETLGYILADAHDFGRMTRRRTKALDDMDGLVARWVETLALLATSHDDQARVKMDAETDELLRPLLRAPIAEVREFVRRVAKALEADERVPWLVWTTFKKLVEPVVLKGKDGKAIELRDLLAVEIANLVVPQLSSEDLVAAVAGALQWRSPTQLAAVKDALEQPEAPKPRLRGRESCLFLSVVDKAGKEIAEVVL